MAGAFRFANMRGGNRVFAALGSAALVGGCAATTDVTSDLEGSRAAIVRDGIVVGSVERSIRETEKGREITTRQTLPVRVEGTRSSTVVEQTTRIEDRDGNTVAIEHRSLVGSRGSITTAEIRESQAFVRREARGDVREKTIALPSTLRFDNGAGLLETWDPQTTPQLEFHTLDVRAPLVERIVYRMADPDDGDGERTLLRLAYADGALRSVLRYYVDQAGELLRSDQPMLGGGAETKASSFADGARVMPPNLVRSSLMASPYRISRDALNGRIRYTFGTEDGIELRIPETGEQRVSTVPGGFVVDICGTCGPGLDAAPATLAAALEPTFWLQADYPPIARIGNKVGASNATDAEKMARLVDWARERLGTIDFAGHVSAAEAVARRAGDCTESAVVLAALGRAAGIPTRVASGIVYSREQYHGVANVFMPHAWVLAYVDGEWKSFDAALEGFDASHVALTISDGDPGSIQAGHQLAALLRWDAMAEVRARPANAER